MELSINNKNLPCYVCQEGVYENILINLKYTFPDGTVLEYSEIPAQRCNKCGDVNFSYKSILDMQNIKQHHG